MMLLDFPKATAGQAACTAAEMPLTSAAASVSILFLSLKMEQSQLSLSCVDLIQTTQDYSTAKDELAFFHFQRQEESLLWLIAIRSQAKPCPLGHWLLLAKHVNGGEKTGNKSTPGEPRTQYLAQQARCTTDASDRAEGWEQLCKFFCLPAPA